MTEDQKRKYWADCNVIIASGSLGKKSHCNIKGCYNHDNYMVFVGAGTRLSSLFGTCCKKHLPLAVDKAIDNRKKTVNDRIRAAEEIELTNAKKLLLT